MSLFGLLAALTAPHVVEVGLISGIIDFLLHLLQVELVRHEEAGDILGIRRLNCYIVVVVDVLLDGGHGLLVPEGVQLESELVLNRLVLG